MYIILIEMQKVTEKLKKNKLKIQSKQLGGGGWVVIQQHLKVKKYVCYNKNETKKKVTILVYRKNVVNIIGTAINND